MKSRPVRQALEIVNYMKSVGRLGPIVIIHLGTNNSTTTEVMDEIMAPLADTPLSAEEARAVADLTGGPPAS